MRTNVHYEPRSKGKLEQFGIWTGCLLLVQPEKGIAMPHSTPSRNPFFMLTIPLLLDFPCPLPRRLRL